MIEGTIKEIRDAEQEAANVVADAKRQSEKISEEAKLASEKLYSDMVSEAQQKAKNSEILLKLLESSRRTRPFWRPEKKSRS